MNAKSVIIYPPSYYLQHYTSDTKARKSSEKEQIPLRRKLVWQSVLSGLGQSLRAMNFHTPTFGA